MNYIGKFISNFKDFYNEINSATLTGAIDVIVIRQDDGTYLSSPFHVRFGKMGVLRSKEKIVDIEINDEPVDIHMKLGDTGEAFFVEELNEDDDSDIPIHLATSPLVGDGNTVAYLEEQLRKLKLEHDLPVQETTIYGDGDLGNDRVNGHLVDVDHVNSSQLNDSGQGVELHSDVVSTNYDETKVTVELPDPAVVTMSSSESKSRSPKNGGHIVSVGSQTNEDAVDEVGISIPSSLSTVTQKRRRRKKSSVKRVPVVSHNHQTSVATPDEMPEDIFQMDDDLDDDTLVDEGSLSSSMTRSASVPTSMLNKFSSKQAFSSSLIDFHPYSDGEVTPFVTGTPDKSSLTIRSRPASPKSDTEYEILRNDATSQTDTEEVSWQWGELPQVPRKVSIAVYSQHLRSARKHAEELAVLSDDDESTLPKDDSGKAPNGTASVPPNQALKVTPSKVIVEDKGIYLDELNPDNMDPEVAALYFPKLRSNLPLKRPNDEDTESGNGPSLPHSPQCTSSAPQSLDSDSSDQERSVTRDSYDLSAISKQYNDLAMSLCGGLSGDVDTSLSEDKFNRYMVPYEDFSRNPIGLLQNPNMVFRIGGKYYGWQAATPILMSLVMFQRPLPPKFFSDLMEKNKKKESRSSWWSWRRSNTVPEPMNKPTDIGIEELMKTAAADAKTQSMSDRTATSTTQTKFDTLMETETNFLSSGSETEDNSTSERINRPKKKKSNHCKKSLRLTSEQITALNLQDGANEVVFSVTTAYQGTTRCKCHIYLWNHDDRIIISDIDGTITKSDVLGHILPILGRDWAQSGVAELFTKCKENGYKLLYLSARAIGQAHITREYLRSVRQGDLCLPDGPLLLSPTSLISAFHREVIEKKPEVFKISCLTDIQALFPLNPFYAGFGNKINDTWAYRAVAIPSSRIFTINHKGELKVELIQTFQSSYTRLSDVVDQMFPPLNNLKPCHNLLSEYGNFSYWRQPIGDLTSSDEVLVSTPAASSSAKDGNVTTSTNGSKK